jgi:MFS transporter, DHA1 family, staphyloferrin A biosynthesis exporter
MPRIAFHMPVAFSALSHRNYRLLWTGNLVSQSGDWMDLVAFNWLVYTLTDSNPLALALANAFRALPLLFFTLIGGVIADRVQRRNLLFSTQAVMMLLAFALAILVSSGSVNIYLIYVIALGRGVTMSFNQPARQSLISELVPPEDLPNAVGLNSATVNLTRVVGPTIGGVLIGTAGVEAAFWVNAFSFLAVLYSLFLMTFPAWEPPRGRRSMFHDLKEGISYLRHEAGLRLLVILALVPMVLGQPYQVMLTIFAKDVFKSGGEGLGLMSAVAAGGAVIGALVVASSRGSTQFHRQMMAGLLGFGGLLALLAIAPSMWIALPILLMIGMSQQTYQTSNNTMLQMNVDPQYRGRILSTLFLQRGMVPLGTVLAGLLTSAFGPRVAMGSMAVSLLVIAVLALPYSLPILKDLSGNMRLQAVIVAAEPATQT